MVESLFVVVVVGEGEEVEVLVGGFMAAASSRKDASACSTARGDPLCDTSHASTLVARSSVRAPEAEKQRKKQRKKGKRFFQQNWTWKNFSARKKRGVMQRCRARARKLFQIFENHSN